MTSSAGSRTDGSASKSVELSGRYDVGPLRYYQGVIVSRTDLNVPFSEKDEAKHLGACWDPKSKVWFAPEGADLSAFHKWLPESPDFNIRSTTYHIAETIKPCWKCGEPTKLIGFLLPDGCEYADPLDPEDEGFGPDDKYTEEELKNWIKSKDSVEWCHIHSPTFLAFITELLEEISRKARKISENYSKDYSKKAGMFYWMNHCQACGMKHGDFELYQEPSGAFFPLSSSDAEKITLHPNSTNFHCSGDYIIRSETFIEHMQTHNAPSPNADKQQGIFSRFANMFTSNS